MYWYAGSTAGCLEFGSRPGWACFYSAVSRPALEPSKWVTGSLYWGVGAAEAWNSHELDVHESVHLDTIMKITSKVHFIFFQALNFLVESFGLLNDLVPFRSILDAGYPVFDPYLADVLFEDALYRLIYYSKSAVHVSGDVFAHHQARMTVFTVSGSVHPSCCRLGTPAGSKLGEHYQIL